MPEITFNQNEKEKIISKIKDYFVAKLDQDIGGFEAEFLIDFFAKEIGPYFYNRGLADAHALFSEKAEELGYLIQELELPTT